MITKWQVTALQSCQVSSPRDPQERAGRQIHLLYTNICAPMLVLSVRCFLWHLGPGRWTDHASMGRTPQAKSDSDQHTVVAPWGQGGGGKHTWHMWGTVIPLDKLTAVSWLYQPLHRSLALWSSQPPQKTEWSLKNNSKLSSLSCVVLLSFYS